jgi:hypothetical protein
MSNNGPPPSRSREVSSNYDEPLSISWLRAFDPRTFTPTTWEHGGTSNIDIRGADNIAVCAVRRGISLYRHLGNGLGLQDQIEGGGDGHHVQLNFMFGDDKSVVTRYPTDEEYLGPTERLRSSIAAILGAVGVEGSRIRARSDNYGIESAYILEGGVWVPERYGRTVNQGAIAPAPFQLPGHDQKEMS